MSTIRTTAVAFAATAALGAGTFATAAPAEAAVCSSRANVYCSMSHAKKISSNLAYGSRGSQVKSLQNALTQVGFRVPATGYFGSQTRSAVKSYQSSRRIAVTGTVNKSTLHALRVGAGAKRSVAKKRTVTSSVAASSNKAQRAVNFAHAQLGKPYVYGATGPNAFDCSGLTGAAWRSAGVSIPRTSYAQYNGLRKVSRGNLQPGDIISFYGGGHVGIYVGNGYVIHAPNSRSVVKKVKMNTMPYRGAVRPA